MRKYISPLKIVLVVSSYWFSINDPTVPFITAALELSDPFVDPEASGIQLYV